jgi:glycosyltransferase involved in cell wall biosynthesis
MASGVPVITSNISSMPEIAGQSAMLLNDPKDINEIVKCIELILKDKKMAGHLIKSGIKQASQFTWNRTAAETLKIYDSLV